MSNAPSPGSASIHFELDPTDVDFVADALEQFAEQRQEDDETAGLAVAIAAYLRLARLRAETHGGKRPR